MRTLTCTFGGLLALLLGASVAGGVLWDEKAIGRKDKVGPFGHRAYSKHFEAGRRALVIVSGNGQGLMGVYVYDEHGNCVARDDAVGGPTKDDLAAEWVPERAGRFSVEVYALDRVGNEYHMAVRQDRAK
jgi:hypothetical protein